jgi:hypothetical protein
MRSISLLIIFIALFLSLHSVVAVPYLLVDRQDDSPSSARSQAAATTDADSRTSSTPASRSSAIATQSGRSSIPTASSSIRVTASNIIQAPATTASDEPLPSSTKGEYRDATALEIASDVDLAQMRIQQIPSLSNPRLPPLWA